MKKTSSRKNNIKKINLALQGGGAHGAFTWGVLDAILDDSRLEVEAITATSAGAMNAAAFAQGYTRGGTEGAKNTLHEFWRKTSNSGAFFSPVQRSPFELSLALNPFLKTWSLDSSWSFAFFDTLSRMVSPYDFNPSNINILRDVVEDVIDMDDIHACECIKLFVSATDVRHNTVRVFGNNEITTDVLMASAALPFLFQAVEVDNEYYWDGGYMGNPSLYPLFYETDSRDILIVHVNPLYRPDVPQRAYEIQNRLNEITFNASLLKEIRAISFVKKLIEDDMLKDEYKDHYKDILIHAIRTDDIMCDLSIASKFDTSWPFLMHLHDMGYEQGQKWLLAHFDSVGKETTVNIQDDYLFKNKPYAHGKKRSGKA